MAKPVKSAPVITHESLASFLDRGGRITRCAPGVASNYLRDDVLLAIASGARFADTVDPAGDLATRYRDTYTDDDPSDTE